jgi:polar amino acid transport system substrate-binding protein
VSIRSFRRPVTLVAVTALAAFGLAACGSSGGSEAESSPSASATVSPIEKDATLAALVPSSVGGTIEVGTDASYAPNEYVDGGDIVGMDVDLGNAIGQVLGVKMKFTNSPFDAIIPGIQSGKYGLGISSFTANAERQKVVNFATYFNAGTQWAVQKGNPQGVEIDNACGKKVAVQKGTVQVDDIKARSKTCTGAGKDAITIEQYQLQSDATNAVASGKDDAMLADSPITAYAVKTAPGRETLGEIYDAAPYGIAIPCNSDGKKCASPYTDQPKDNVNLTKAVQGAIQKLIDDGQYKQILTVWGVEQGAITTSEINPAK